MPKDAPPNGGAVSSGVPMGPRRRVSEMQAKLHRWAAADPGRRFDDLFNFVHDPATLIVAFDRVAGQHRVPDCWRGRPHGRRRPGAGRGAGVPG
jgi:RNA-directed DNA polymerase